MSDRPLWQWAACDLAEAIANREISAEEAVSSAIERANAVNPRLNAIVDAGFEQALDDARDRDRALVSGDPVGCLHGVPVTVKINVDQRGRATTNGVAAYRNAVAEEDSPIAANLLRAGAVIVGRTNTPEFSFRVTTDNELYGRTVNPWNDQASPGGSSGGAASAVMSGMCAVAHGNDIGGSLRYPAAATGAATVKPGLGRVPAYNPSQPAERGLLAQIMSVQGAIAREIRDVRLAMQALTAYDPRDPWMVEAPFERPPPARPVRVAHTTEMFEFDLHPAVAEAMATARRCLADAGYEVVGEEPPEVRECARDGVRCLLGEARVFMAREIHKHGSATFRRVFDDYEAIFEPFEGEELLRGLARRNRYCRLWNLFLERYPLVLSPFMPTPTYAWDRDAQGPDGVREALGAGVYGIAMNFMGLPAGIVAAGFHDGLPVGVQISGPRFSESLILDACEAIESRVGVMAERLFAREG